MAITRDQILRPRKLPTEVVPCPELGDGVTLIVRRLTAREFMALSAKVKAQPDLAYAHWIVATVIDEQGATVFNEDDAAALGEQDTTLVERLTSAAMKLNVNGKGEPGKNSTTPSVDP